MSEPAPEPLDHIQSLTISRDGYGVLSVAFPPLTTEYSRRFIRRDSKLDETVDFVNEQYRRMECMLYTLSGLTLLRYEAPAVYDAARGLTDVTLDAASVQLRGVINTFRGPAARAS